MILDSIAKPKIVGADEWLRARKELLAEEKALTRQRDAVDRKRRELPWTEVKKEYVFEGPEGKVTLAELFEGRSQLIVSHFMFGPDWKEGCVGCSFRSDHVDGTLAHLEHHDVSLVTVSRAPINEIEPFKERMGWRFKWVSSFGSDFNYDFGVSYEPNESGKVVYNYVESDFLSEEMSGLSVFYKDEAGRIFHTYSTYGRGDEMVDTTYMYLDITPKGRNETGPRGNLTDWVRHHDRYDAAGSVDHRGRYVAVKSDHSCGCESSSESSAAQG